MSKEEIDVLRGDKAVAGSSAFVVDSDLSWCLSTTGVADSDVATLEEFVAVEAAEGGGVGGGSSAMPHSVTMLKLVSLCTVFLVELVVVSIGVEDAFEDCNVVGGVGVVCVSVTSSGELPDFNLLLEISGFVLAAVIIVGSALVCSFDDRGTL